jgi:hypothetical protein
MAKKRSIDDTVTFLFVAAPAVVVVVGTVMGPDAETSRSIANVWMFAVQLFLGGAVLYGLFLFVRWLVRKLRGW